MTVSSGHAEPHRTPAAALAACLLQGLDARLKHSAAVATQMSRVADLVEPDWRSPAKDAAWLHDVGYSPTVALTGFHALDGARWLRDHGWPDRTCRLIAWHTESFEEARLHCLDGVLLAEFAAPPRRAAAAIAWADLTSSPRGERWAAERRVAEILNRYPPGSIVHEVTHASLPALRAAVREIEELFYQS